MFFRSRASGSSWSSLRRPRRLVAVAGLLCVVPTLTTTAVSATPTAPAVVESASSLARADVGWVTGKVVDNDGKPIAGALVNVLGPEEVPEKALLPDVTDRRTTTDQDGHFRVRQHSDGYIIQACQPSPDRPNSCQETALGVEFVITYSGPDGVTDSWLRQTRLFSAATADRNVGTVTVTRPGQIAGRIAGAGVSSIAVKRLNDTVAFRADTDRNGNYTVKGLTAGRYYVSAEIGGRLPWRSADIDVISGRTVEVNGALSKGASIKGVLVKNGKPVAGTDVIVSKKGQWIAAGTTNRKGAFTFSGFVPGRYRVGILYEGGAYRPSSKSVTVTSASATRQVRLTAKPGATLRFQPFENGRRAKSAIDELRDADGVPVLKQSNVNGTVTYTGLAPGTYTAVVRGKNHFATRKVRIRNVGLHDLGRVAMTRRTLTLSGRTAPGAVVEATTGDLCPPGGQGQRTGAFDEFAKAGADGRYELTGLVAGRYMIGADGWPGNYVPYCRSDVALNTDKTIDLPLASGTAVSGRLVYGSTGQPVITPLSYNLNYGDLSTNNPTDEHPARGKTQGATGVFRVDGLRSGAAVGSLADETGENVTDERYFVIFPYQDGTPYWYETAERPIQVAGATVDLGDINVTLRGLTTLP